MLVWFPGLKNGTIPGAITKVFCDTAVFFWRTPKENCLWLCARRQVTSEF